ncbi:MAG: phosphoglycerate dehydrogenase [Desulfovibrionaceae bacterium]|nr:phosphoglycerate dehydrogenase [Desulfovibrionaceae bacterium]
MKVAITTSSFGKFSQEPLELLKRHGIEPVLNPYGRTLTEDEMLEILPDCVGAIAGTEKYTAEILNALTGLKVISRCGTGMDSIDLNAAKELGIMVKNTPDAPTEAVAELVVGLAFDLARSISRQDRDIRAGKWKKQMGGLVSAMNVGIVGMGRIGRAVAAKFTALGARCAYSDPFVKDGPCPRQELEELLAWADLLTLHVPGGERPLLGSNELRLMKPGAFILNCSRGGVVDESSLYELLTAGVLGGAALDVFESEPYHGNLCRLDNVILTPHIGSYARQARVEMEREAALNLLSALGAAEQIN